MGSRLNISLQQLLGNPKIEVRMYARQLDDGDDNPGGHPTVIESASVTFFTHNEVTAHDFTFEFDSHAHGGVVELSCDWNWFRYPNDPEHFSRKMMRALYENSVSFTVHH